MSLNMNVDFFQHTLKSQCYLCSDLMTCVWYAFPAGKCHKATKEQRHREDWLQETRSNLVHKRYKSWWWILPLNRSVFLRENGKMSWIVVKPSMKHHLNVERMTIIVQLPCFLAAGTVGTPTMAPALAAGTVGTPGPPRPIVEPTLLPISGTMEPPLMAKTSVPSSCSAKQVQDLVPFHQELVIEICDKTGGLGKWQFGMRLRPSSMIERFAVPRLWHPGIPHLQPGARAPLVGATTRGL